MGTEVTGGTELRTPLYDTHVKYKGKIVPFAGYLLPVQYDTGVIAEHMAVRTKCGLFDVSHMGEIIKQAALGAACLMFHTWGRSSAEAVMHKRT